MTDEEKYPIWNHADKEFPPFGRVVWFLVKRSWIASRKGKVYPGDLSNVRVQLRARCCDRCPGPIEIWPITDLAWKEIAP